MTVRKFLFVSLLLLIAEIGRAKDVVAAYNLSEISSCIRVDGVGEKTFSEIRDALDSLHQRFHSVDFVIDLYECKGNYGSYSITLADSLSRLDYRFAFIVSQHTASSGLLTAMLMRHRGKAVVVGDVKDCDFTPDVQLQSNNSYMNAWNDSLHVANVIEKTVDSFLSKNDVRNKYGAADRFIEGTDFNGIMIDCLFEVLGKEGISKDFGSFETSGFVLLCEMKAEICRKVYPESPEAFYKAIAVPYSTAMKCAVDVLESSQYRRILKK